MHMPLCNTLASFFPAHTQNWHFAHKQETSSVCPLVDFQPHPRNNQYDQNNAPSLFIIPFLEIFSNSIFGFLSFWQSIQSDFHSRFTLYFTFLLFFTLFFFNFHFLHFSTFYMYFFICSHISSCISSIVFNLSLSTHFISVQSYLSTKLTAAL